MYLFADDTKVFRHIVSSNDNQILQDDIDSLLNWSDLWLLKFHPDKCVCMGIGSSRNDERCRHYTMKGHILNNTPCEKDLGVLFDNSLKFDKHITAIINKANRTLGIIRKLLNF